MNEFRSTASVETLKVRASLLRQTRQFFDVREFVEVQTPLLSADTVVDRHLDPVSVLLPNDALDQTTGRWMWLQTSPEFAMKRLVACGMDAIYQITPAFRIGECGRQHNPEFMMLEWYRRGDSMSEGIELLADFAAELLDRPQATAITIQKAFEIHAGVNPLRLSASELLEVCETQHVEVPVSMDRHDWDLLFELLFTALVQPKLGHGTPAIIYDYPASHAALARIRADEPNVAERFELFVDGVELANGYHELLDANELLQRNHAVNQQRRADGKVELPVDSRLLDAMRDGLPPCVGVALGFDRLVMLATGSATIREVISFPTDLA